jgi:hypothetical protein
MAPEAEEPRPETSEEGTYTYIRIRSLDSPPPTTHHILPQRANPTRIEIYVPERDLLWVRQVQAALIRDGSSISSWTLSQLRAWWDLHSPGNPQTGMERFVESGVGAPARLTRLEAGRVNLVADMVEARWLKDRLKITLTGLERLSASNAAKARTAASSSDFEVGRTSKQIILQRLLKHASRLPVEVRDEELVRLVTQAEKWF